VLSCVAMAVQHSEEFFASNDALILVNEENALAAVAVEPKRSLLCERVNIGGCEVVVDERRLAAAGRAFEEEAPDVTPTLCWRDELLVVRDAAIDARVGGGIHCGGVCE